MRSLTCWLGSLGIIFIVGAQLHAQSAKAIYADPSDNTSYITGQQNGANPDPHATAHTRPPQRPGPAAKYWFELRRSDRSIRKVTSDYEFHSGDRVRLHLASNVDGTLTIMQSEDDGPFQMLYPTLPGAENRVVGRHDNAFPSDQTWFRFDNHPGKVQLMVMITPGGVDTQRGEPDTRRPAPDVPALARSMSSRDAELVSSKALLQETPQGDTATYVALKPAKQLPARAAIVFVIVLRHRP